MTCSHGLKQKSWISFAFGGQKTAFLFELFPMMWYTIFCQDSKKLWIGCAPVRRLPSNLFDRSVLPELVKKVL